jgi:hypothetical protein
LAIKGGGAFVTDFNSTNGTLVNGGQITGEVELLDADQLSSKSCWTRPRPPPSGHRRSRANGVRTTWRGRCCSASVVRAAPLQWT